MQVDIKVDLTALEQAADVFKKGFNVYDLHETREAVEAGAQAIQAEWMRYISGVTVAYSGGEFRINRVTGQYASAVMGGLRYPMDGNLLKGGVEVNLDYAQKLERGWGPFDQKPGLLNSPKAKWTAGPDDEHPDRESHPYIDVPFEHKETDIPKGIKAEAKAGRSLGLIRLGKGLGSAPAGLRSKTAPGDMGMEPYTHKSGIYAGLMRKAAGPAGGGKYITFRRVSANSDPSSWIHPGTDPKPVTKALEENIGAKLTSMVSSGFERDILRLSRLSGLMP